MHHLSPVHHPVYPRGPAAIIISLSISRQNIMQFRVPSAVHSESLLITVNLYFCSPAKERLLSKIKIYLGQHMPTIDHLLDLLLTCCSVMILPIAISLLWGDDIYWLAVGDPVQHQVHACSARPVGALLLRHLHLRLVGHSLLDVHSTLPRVSAICTILPRALASWLIEWQIMVRMFWSE